MKCPLFRRELERLRSEIVSDTVAQLKVYSLQAVCILADLMNSSASESIKRGCATDILENARSFIQRMIFHFGKLKKKKFSVISGTYTLLLLMVLFEERKRHCQFHEGF